MFDADASSFFASNLKRPYNVWLVLILATQISVLIAFSKLARMTCLRERMDYHIAMSTQRNVIRISNFSGPSYALYANTHEVIEMECID